MTMTETVPLSALVQVGAALVKNQNPITRFAKRSWNTWVRKSPGPERILIAGTGGTGKSTLLKLLTGKGSEVDPRYVQSNVIEHGSLFGDVFGTIWCMPGQDNPFDLQLSSPSSSFISNKVGSTTGILIVVAFGYNTIRNASIQSLPEGVRPQRLQEESELFAALGKMAGKFKRLRWITIVINKRDIWLDQEAECESHYQDQLALLKNALSAAGQGPHVQLGRIPVSFISANVKRVDGSILYEIDPQYDDVQRREDVGQFLATASSTFSSKL